MVYLKLHRYLRDAYHQEVLGTGDIPVFDAKDPLMIEEAKNEINRIKSIKSPDLSRRDFVSYKSLQILERELAKLDAL